MTVDVIMNWLMLVGMILSYITGILTGTSIALGVITKDLEDRNQNFVYLE